MKRALIAGAVALFLLMNIPLIHGDTNPSVEVFFEGPEGPYYIGDNIEIDVYVFDKGVSVDGMTVFELEEYDGTPIAFDAVEVNTGYWTVSFVVPHTYSLKLTASGSVDFNPFSRTMYGSVSDPTIHVSTFSPKEVYAPGETVNVFITTYRYGDVAYCDSMSVTFDTSPGIVTELGVGRYVASYVVPLSEGSSRVVYVYVDAASGSATGTGLGSFKIGVLQIYFEKITTSTTGATFDLHVSDLNGYNVNGAEVALDYGYYNEVENVYYNEHIVGSTNSEGVVRFNTPFVTEYNLLYEGYVYWSGYNQSIRGALFIGLDEYDYIPSGVVAEFDTVSTGQQSLDFTFLDTYGDPVPSQTLYWYAEFESGIGSWGLTNGFIDGGIVTTNGQGKFVIQLNVPSDARVVKVVFDTLAGEGYDYDTDDGVFVVKNYVYVPNLDFVVNPYNTDLVITVPKVELGTEFTVSVDVPKDMDSGYVLCSIYTGDLGHDTMWSGEYGEEEVAWWGWEDVSAEKWMSYDSSTNTYVSTFRLPFNLEKEGDYTVFVAVVDPSGNTAWYNSLVFTEGADPSTSPISNGTSDSDDGVLCLSYIGMPLTASLFLAAVVANKRGWKK